MNLTSGCQRRKVLPDEAPRLYSIDEENSVAGSDAYASYEVVLEQD
jgi:hypothetical protein